MSANYRPTGTMTAGTGYFAAIYSKVDTAGTHYAALICLGPFLSAAPIALQPCSSFTDAHELMTRFCACAARWNRVKSTSAWLAADPSHAVIGTW